MLDGMELTFQYSNMREKFLNLLLISHLNRELYDKIVYTTYPHLKMKCLDYKF